VEKSGGAGKHPEGLTRARQAQGRSVPWTAKGGEKRSAKCHGLAALPQYRAVKPTGFFAQAD